MNPEQTLNKIGSLLVRSRPARPGLYMLIRDGDDFCIESHDYKALPPVTLVVHLQARDINQGPSQKTWDRILKRLGVILHKEKAAT